MRRGGGKRRGRKRNNFGIGGKGLTKTSPSGKGKTATVLSEDTKGEKK